LDPVSREVNNLSMSTFKFVADSIKLCPITLKIVVRIIHCQQRPQSLESVPYLWLSTTTHLT
jgi:hypothetical protein